MTALNGRVVVRMHICGRKIRAILDDVDPVHTVYTATQGAGGFHPFCGPYDESVTRSTYLLGHSLYSGAAHIYEGVEGYHPTSLRSSQLSALHPQCSTKPTTNRLEWISSSPSSSALLPLRLVPSLTPKLSKFRSISRTDPAAAQAASWRKT